MVNEKTTRNNQPKDVGDLPHSYFIDLKKRAKKEGVPFTLTEEYLWLLFRQQHGRCALSESELTFSCHRKNKTEQTASIDRIDSSKPYMQGNVQWVHKDIVKMIVMMKSTFSEESLVKICKLLTGQTNQLDTRIIVRLQVEGLHCWSTCDIEEVSYLKSLHRHQFHIIGTKVVTHDDRDIEFIRLSHQIKSHLDAKYYSDQYKCLNFGSQSCEMLARELIQTFDLTSCEVNEDGEGGAVLTQGTI